MVTSRISRLAACVGFVVTAAATGCFLGDSAGAAPRVACSDPRNALAAAVHQTLTMPRLVTDSTTNGVRTQHVVFLGPDREQLTAYRTPAQSAPSYVRIGSDVYISQGDGRYGKSVEPPETPFVAQQALDQLASAVDLSFRNCTAKNAAIKFRIPPAELPQKLVRSVHGEARIGPNGVIADSVSLTLASGKTRRASIVFHAGNPALRIEPPPEQDVDSPPIRGL